MNAMLASFRDRHAGGTVVVCGCGPSLNTLPDPQRWTTIGVNDVGRLFDPSYLVVVNPPSQFKGDRFRFVAASRAQALFTQLDLGPVAPPVVRFRLGQYAGTDVGRGETLHYTQNSPYVAVMLAALMGARRIGLIGVDLSDGHFFGGHERHVLAPRLQEIDAQYGRLAAALAQRGIELVNLSATSRLQTLRRGGHDWLELSASDAPALAPRAPAGLRIVSYATTPVAGVPELLARCIAHSTPHEAHCVWGGGRYGTGVSFEGGVDWHRQAREANALLDAADVVIVHNGKVAPLHARLLARKPLVTMAHNYGWNVDMQHVRRGGAGLVVGQYQATLPEFAGWEVVPNPLPLWEASHAPEAKGERIRIAYTPSGRHERYPPNHRLYWHGKGFETTLQVLRRLARRPNVVVESTEHGQMSHAQALAVKRRAHIVIDECVTGSYHRNSLEGLAAGSVVVNGVGLLAGVEDALRRCAPDAERLPFVFSTLASLESTLLGLIEQGPAALEAAGRDNSAWMRNHWDFAAQWPRFWAAACDPARAPRAMVAVRPPAPAPRPQPVAPRVLAAPRRATVPPPKKESAMPAPATDLVSVIVPHGGTERLRQLGATLATLRQREGVGEIIVVDMGSAPVALDMARRWADRHLFVAHDGPFERARALNAGAAIASCPLLLWHDNDLLTPPGFIAAAARELRERRLDHLTPFSAVRYLGEADTQRVMQGTADPADCRPVNTLQARATAFGGGMGLVARDFVQRHGGFVEGFRGWGGEDNAWSHKVGMLGRAGRTLRSDATIVHLHHPGSGGQGPGAASNANPHYRDNVALMQRVCAVRNAAQFSHQFPPAAAASGVLTRFDAPGRVALPPTVWGYWEGPCPDWIRACWRSIAAAAPHVRLLDPASFERLRDTDRDIDLSRLQVAHRADYIRMFMLQRYGGLWIDADCLAMQPLQPVLDLLATHEMVGHRERSGLVSNGFVAARAGSRLVSEVYRRICDSLRSRRPLGWTSIGSEPLSAAIAANPQGWHELACERVQPICWSEPQAFFARGSEAQHAARFDAGALCYMLSNTQIRQYQAAHPREELSAPDSFFSHLQRRAMARTDTEAVAATPGDAYEVIFARHAELYRQFRDESISGPGSNLQQTQQLRERLPLLLQQLGVRSLLDAPCGDFNWMRRVRLGVEAYVGVDILGEVIADHRQRHGDALRSFMRIDLMQGDLPRADAIFCRDLLVHLSYEDAWAVLENFRRSGAQWLLTTHFTGGRVNRDTANGDWRPLDLRAAPFHFPEPALLLVEKCSEAGGAYGDKCMAVWRLADLPAARGVVQTAPAEEALS